MDQFLKAAGDSGDVEEAVDGSAHLEDLLGLLLEPHLFGVLDEEHAILDYARIITK